MPCSVQLKELGQPLKPLHCAGVAHAHDENPKMLLGATSDAMIGKAVIDANPIFFNT